jgi:hypothetical protein
MSAERMKKRIGPSDYYDTVPPAAHAPGDIWLGLPTMGLLRLTHVAGLVITPACDLANQKAETVTYVPVVPITTYFASQSFLPEVMRAIENHLKGIGADGLNLTDGRRFGYPSASTVRTVMELISSASPRDDINNRLIAGLRYVESSRQTGKAELPDLRQLLGPKPLTETIQKLIRNAYRLDLHFLPHDEQITEWSGVPEHSVALFRYPITAPTDVLDAANAPTITDWAAAVSELEVTWPVAVHFRQKRPMKRVSVKPRFLSDLLTRYVALHVRLGSPDFTAETVTEYARQIVEV